jgi:butyrate kinase
MKNQAILVINTGATSTKVGIFHHHNPVVVESIRHADEELARFKDINDQKDFREQVVLEWLKEKETDIDNVDNGELAAVAARGGMLKPVESGTYTVNENMLNDLREGARGMHASHLSAQVGHAIAQKKGITCYIVDPVSVDEYEPAARFSGHKLFERISMSHALNMKAVAKRFAKEKKLDYTRITLIVVHLGSGISVSLHKNGRMIDGLNSAEEGPFSPDRSGGLPSLQVAKYCLEHKPDYETFAKSLFGSGGLNSYLGTKDFIKITKMYRDGDQEVINLVNAMAYQVAKEVGALATVTYGQVDSILITGGMAHAGYFTDMIKERVQFIAPVLLYPGEDEMEALAQGVCRVLDNEEETKIY